jgi:hypothetical protein
MGLHSSVHNSSSSVGSSTSGSSNSMGCKVWHSGAVQQQQQQQQQHMQWM